ncbi:MULTISPECIES: hypothetical protein [Streptomyces]|uniref:ANTAR domain-containing protein n=2 Tax=Streptomyces TaxID=1883 RepID=A0ABU4JZG6_9ACTN|nr:hypothetical protein [Streptomyces roseolus]MDX2290893.1 hypothetical protein [Streptomyces roseolus]
MADTWAAKHAEARRVRTLLETTGRAVYGPADDETATCGSVSVGSTARGVSRPPPRPARADRAGAPGRGGPAAPALPVRAALLQQAAARTGLTPEQALAQLAARAETTLDTEPCPYPRPGHP